MTKQKLEQLIPHLDIYLSMHARIKEAADRDLGMGFNRDVIGEYTKALKKCLDRGLMTKELHDRHFREFFEGFLSLTDFHKRMKNTCDVTWKRKQDHALDFLVCALMYDLGTMKKTRLNAAREVSNFLSWQEITTDMSEDAVLKRYTRLMRKFDDILWVVNVYCRYVPAPKDPQGFLKHLLEKLHINLTL